MQVNFGEWIAPFSLTVRSPSSALAWQELLNHRQYYLPLMRQAARQEPRLRVHLSHCCQIAPISFGGFRVGASEFSGVALMAGIRELIAGWVHGSVHQNPVESARHTYFIQMRLMVTLIAFALVPPYLALRGVPAFWEICAFVSALLPLGSVGVLSRTGRLTYAHAVSIAGLGLASVAIAAGLGGLSAAAIAWLVLAPLEAAIAGSMPLLVGAVSMSFATLVFSALLASFGAPGQDVSPLVETLFVAPALLYAGALGFGAITAAGRREKIAHVDSARYETLAAALGELVLQQDRSGAVLSASSASETLFGLQSRDLMGRGLFERILVQDRPAYLKAIADTCDELHTATTVIRMRTGLTTESAGTYREPIFAWIELRARRIKAGDDSDFSVMSVVRDISRERRAEEAREQAHQDAERTRAWKDRFLANVSHELRTPLNAIIGFSEMLGNDALMPKDPAKRKEYADIINSSGQHLLAVVNSILDMSKIEAGRFDILAEPFEVGPLIDACCDILSLKAEQAGVALVRDRPAHIEELVADKRACRQILLNLLSNALKFTPRDGRITIGVRPEGNMLAFYVADTGIGIKTVDLPHLGDAFFQSSSAYDRTHEGTGLGLSVVRGLVGLHGGSISIESSEGEGTCVTVRLPLDCRSSSNKRTAVPIEIGPRQITRFDDYPPHTKMVKKIA
jgi:cell cycle sensor histidine kinase DivJ